jgi:hypothetical protein
MEAMENTTLAGHLGFFKNYKQVREIHLEGPQI